MRKEKLFSEESPTVFETRKEMLNPPPLPLPSSKRPANELSADRVNAVYRREMAEPTMCGDEKMVCTNMHNNVG
ncbi:hypothetical protein POVCU2_0016210 [Plasmodium ovale curtisi]|uniref:Uncharacterized protein n=1 Tax=Plasmodium ovale curtisi TaxID=864141 RepID=A0A1A8W3B9_PLAOA|nr:hypothetical protein POVCU2_0016210 [Plasmodium ovale curtisi]SBS87412.1 hypothetical protein POVCU1_014500 [Plasmodium ovale curtisi]